LTTDLQNYFTQSSIRVFQVEIEFGEDLQCQYPVLPLMETVADVIDRI